MTNRLSFARTPAAAALIATCLLLSCSKDPNGVRHAPVLGAGSGSSEPDAGPKGSLGNSDGQAQLPQDAGRPGDGSMCAWAHAKPVRLTPSVYLVLEYSVSTASTNGFVAHWTNLHDALLAPGGVVDQFQSSVELGAVVYGGDSEDDPSCPTLMNVDPAFGTLAAISAIAPAVPPSLSARAGHPVYALERVRAHFAEQRAASPGLPLVQAIVFAHGSVNLDNVCSKDLDARKQAGETTIEDVGPRAARDTVKALAGEGVKTFVVAMLDSGSAVDAQNDALAKLGATGHGAFAPQNANDIKTALAGILREIVSCQFPLDGEVTVGRECDGKVSVAGNAIACNDPNGWRLKDKSTIELGGSACEQLRDDPNATVDAQFPCAIWKGPE